MSHAASDALHARVRSFIDESIAGGEVSESFDALALDLARFQREHVPAVGRLVRARAIDLARATSASAIPAVPTDVFRLARVAAHSPDDDAIVFRTSGTSQGQEARGEHPLRITSTYDAAALAWGKRALFFDRDRMRVLVLAPPPAEASDSSLGFMLASFAKALGGRGEWFVNDGAIDVEGLARACASAREEGAPVLVLGTSFAFVHLLEAKGDGDLALPPRSRAMQTGGFKGKSREVPAAELRASIAQAFALEPRAVVAEYGMTELGSQLYDATLSANGEPLVYYAPPWLSVVPVDPISLEPVAPAEIGIARFVDLVNVDSAVAIQTADRIRVRDDGGVELLGRMPGAVPRGCSIAIDEVLGDSA